MNATFVMVPILRWAFMLSLGCVAYAIFVLPATFDTVTQWPVLLGGFSIGVLMPSFAYLSVRHSNETLFALYLCMQGIVGASALMCCVSYALMVRDWVELVRHAVDLMFCVWIAICSLGIICSDNEFVLKRSLSKQTFQEMSKTMPSPHTPKKKPDKIMRTPPKHTKRVTDHAKNVKKRVGRVLKQSKKALRAKVAKRRTMTSFSQPGAKSYSVTQYSCTCPDYMFRRRKKGERCKHMEALFEEMSKAPVTTHNK